MFVIIAPEKPDETTILIIFYNYKKKHGPNYRIFLVNAGSHLGLFNVDAAPTKIPQEKLLPCLQPKNYGPQKAGCHDSLGESQWETPYGSDRRRRSYGSPLLESLGNKLGEL